MINYLQGKITYKNDKSLILENQGIGYKVFCSPNTLNKISDGEEVKLFTHLYLREEVVELYGFLAREELELFETLNEISGIGPKTATMLASFGSLERLKELMEKGQLPPGIKGIGAKKMQKILLELTGKIKELKTFQSDVPFNEEKEVLVSLGFTPQKAKTALSQLPEDIKDPGKRIKEALKILGR